MAEALKTNKTLEEIHVGNLMVGCTVRLKSSGEEKVVTAMDVYNYNVNIQVQGSDSKIKPSEFDPIPAVLSAKQLRENTIETLDLNNKGLGIDGGLMLAALVAGNEVFVITGSETCDGTYSMTTAIEHGRFVWEATVKNLKLSVHADGDWRVTAKSKTPPLTFGTPAETITEITEVKITGHGDKCSPSSFSDTGGWLQSDGSGGWKARPEIRVRDKKAQAAEDEKHRALLVEGSQKFDVDDDVSPGDVLRLLLARFEKQEEKLERVREEHVETRAELTATRRALAELTDVVKSMNPTFDVN